MFITDDSVFSNCCCLCRLQQLVGYAASYYVPKQKRPQPSAAALQDAGTATGTAGKHNNSTAAADAAEAAATQAACRSNSAPTGNMCSDSQSLSRHDRTAPTAAKAADGSAAPHPPPRPQQQQQQQQQQLQRKRSRREEASAHNRAVLAGAFSDEAIAAELQQQLDAEAVQAAGGAAGGRKGRAAKPPERKGDKVRKKLLGLK
jgi:hypothetical protein